ISPEQAAGEKGIDRRADLYSVGVMMYEMLTGKLPFDAENPVSIALKQINEQPKAPSEIVPTIPKGLEQIVLFAMEKDKDKRFQTATQMIDLLLKVRENPGVIFRQKNQSGKTPKKKKKKVTMVPIIMGVVTAFLIVAVVAAFTVVKNVFFGETVDNTVTITVEDYVGSMYDEALQDELDDVFRVKVKYEYSENIASGKILRQIPAAGSTRKGQKGKQIADLTLYVSQGVEQIVMADYTYADKRQTQIDLKNQGLKVTMIEEYNDIVPDDCVISTSPKAGEPVAAGSTVIVMVSKGEMVDTTVVPSFIGRNTVDAYEMLVQSDLRLGTITYRYHDSDYGTVIDQSLAAGTSASKGVAKISFVISRGPASPYGPSAVTTDASGGVTEEPIESTEETTTAETEETTTTRKTSFEDWLFDRFKER
ncbi:MAG: PASTA domain-containing protein, partial [Clostridia bacterium]|nr:PASTA domain-containing protein [Clostridia bacterium]